MSSTGNTTEPADERATDRSGVESRLRPGEEVGRYVVIAAVGSGGGGEVYSAWDPHLTRRVALKLIGGTGAGARNAELLQEAKVLARLNHPNIVQVFETLRHDDAVVIAMEFVEGETFEPVPQRPRRWQEWLDLYLQAAEALQAAHAEGLVHGDFKPRNVMVDHQGRVRVLDFGLARSASRAEAESTLSASARRLDLGGAGTPGYMAPESFRGEGSSPATDQFAFCVSLWQALSGERPFAGSTRAAVAAAVVGGDRTEPSSWGTTPRAVQAALRRGLAPDVGDRFPSMEALSRALRGPERARTRARWLGVSVGAAGLGAGVMAIASWANDAPCEGVQAPMHAVWSADTRARLSASLASVELPFAEAASARVDRALNTFAERWTVERLAACEAIHVRREQSPEGPPLRAACLEHQLREFEASVEVLGQLDESNLLHADRVLDGLPSLAECTDVPRLRRGPPQPPEGEADAVQRTQHHLARTRAEVRAGRWVAAGAALKRAEVEAAGVSHADTRADLAFVRATVEELAQDADAAEESLRESLRIAFENRRFELSRRAATQLLFVVGGMQELPAEALRYAELAAGFSDDVQAEADYRHALGRVRERQGDDRAAEQEYRSAVELFTDALGPEHLTTVNAQASHAGVLRSLGELEAAESQLRGVLTVLERRLGAVHPKVAGVLANLAVVLRERGELDRSLAVAQRSLDIRVAVFGETHRASLHSLNVVANTSVLLGALDEAQPRLRRLLELSIRSRGTSHPSTHRARARLANVHMLRGELGPAKTLYQEVVAGFAEAQGPEHADTLGARAQLAHVLNLDGEPERAIALLEPSIAVATASLGDSHPRVAFLHDILADSYAAVERFEAAEASLRRSLVIREANEGADPSAIAEIRRDLALLLLELDRGPEAKVLAETAHEVLRDSDKGPGALGDTAFVLARAVRVSRGDESRVRSLADEAIRHFRAAHQDERVDEVRTWLR